MVLLLPLESENPLLPAPIEIILAVVFIIFLTVVISRFVVPRFEATYAERTAAIQGGIEKAEKAQEEAAAALEQYNAQLAEARTEAARIREDAKTQGTQILAELREQAQAEANRIKAQGEAQLDAERAQVMAQLRSEIGGLATTLASRIVGESLRGRRAGPAYGRPVHRRPRGPVDGSTRRTVMTTATDTRLSALDKLLDEALSPQYRRRRASSARWSARSAEPRASPTSLSLPADLFAVVDALESSATLRRAVTDPGAPEQARRQLVHSLLDGKVSTPR